MAADIPHAHPPRIHGDDLVIEPVDPGLALADQARLEAAIPIARNVDLESSGLALHGLAPGAVPPVRLHRRGRLTGFVAQVIRQFRSQHPLHQRSLEPLHQTAVAKQVLRPLAALQQFVDQVVVDLLRQPPEVPPWTAIPKETRTTLTELVTRMLLAHVRDEVAGPEGDDERV